MGEKFLPCHDTESTSHKVICFQALNLTKSSNVTDQPLGTGCVSKTTVFNRAVNVVTHMVYI